MRKTLILILMVLVSVAWVAAQQPESRSGAPDNPQQTGPATNSDRPMPPAADQSGQASQPSSSASSSTQSSSGQVIEGCLGGSAPDFTVTDKAGTVYKLDIPKDADASQLSSHVGESVKVRGSVMSASSSASSDKAEGSASKDSAAGSAPASPAAGSTPSSSTSSSQQTIMVEQIGRGTGTCPASSAPPSSK